MSLLWLASCLDFSPTLTLQPHTVRVEDREGKEAQGCLTAFNKKARSSLLFLLSPQQGLGTEQRLCCDLIGTTESVESWKS